MKPVPSILPTLALILLLASRVSAVSQAVPGLTSSGVDASLTRLFGEHKAFSARADLTVQDKSGRELLSTTMGYTVLDGKVRMDVNISELRSSELPIGVGGLKQLGMERVVSLILPAQRSSYLIYPGLGATLKVPMDEDELKGKGSVQDFQLKRVAIGKETIERHACVKYRVTLTDPSGMQQEAVTWNSADLKDFPLRIQMADGHNLVIMRFRDVRLTAPRAELFALPAGFTQYQSQEALMQAVMMKAVGGLGTLGQP